MLALFLTSFWCSLDSLVAALAIGPVITCPRLRWRLIALFGICDGLATLLGLTLGAAGLWAHWAGPVVVLTLGVYFLTAATWNKFRANLRLLFLLPVLLSLDNLTCGGGVGSLQAGVVPTVLAFGLTSSLLAGMGLASGQLVRYPDVRVTKCFTGFALVAAGLVLLSF